MKHPYEIFVKSTCIVHIAGSGLAIGRGVPYGKVKGKDQLAKVGTSDNRSVNRCSTFCCRRVISTFLKKFEKLLFLILSYILDKGLNDFLFSTRPTERRTLIEFENVENTIDSLVCIEHRNR